MERSSIDVEAGDDSAVSGVPIQRYSSLAV